MLFDTGAAEAAGGAYSDPDGAAEPARRADSSAEERQGWQRAAPGGQLS